MREVLGRHTLLASSASHMWDAGSDEVRALQEYQDVIWVDEQRPYNVQFGGATANPANQIAEYSRLPIFETRRDLG